MPIKSEPSPNEPVKRGDIFLVDLEPVSGKETGKARPALIIQNDIGNKYSPVTIIAPISSVKEITKPLPIMVFLRKSETGLKEDSFVDCGQIRTVDKKSRLIKKLTSIDSLLMVQVDRALKISLSLD